MANLKRFIVVLMLLFVSGCAMQWQPALDVSREDTATNQSQKLLASAENCFDSASNAENLDICRTEYLSVLQVNPGDYRALTRLSTINTLIGTAYKKSSSDKSDYFLRAMRYAELAMYTNPGFRSAVHEGAPLWEAVDNLEKEEVEAMLFWVTALQYEFKEGMSFPAKVINIKWLQRALSVLNRIEAVAPDFGGGGVEIAKVVCYYALPKWLGGSKQLGDSYMAAAVERNSDWLLPRWARGKYYYVITGQAEKSQQDLIWVTGQNPDHYHDPYPWRLHFKENAALLLK